MKTKDTVYAIEADGDLGVHQHLYTYDGAMFALKSNLILNAHARQEGKDIDDLIQELVKSGYLAVRPIDVLDVTAEEKGLQNDS